MNPADIWDWFTRGFTADTNSLAFTVSCLARFRMSYNRYLCKMRQIKRRNFRNNILHFRSVQGQNVAYLAGVKFVILWSLEENCFEEIFCIFSCPFYRDDLCWCLSFLGPLTWCKRTDVFFMVAKRAMPLAPRARTRAESLPVVALSKVNHFSRYGPRQEFEFV